MKENMSNFYLLKEFRERLIKIEIEKNATNMSSSKTLMLHPFVHQFNDASYISH